MAFDAIRMARRPDFRSLSGNFDAVHEVPLYDGLFEAPLSWSFSRATKHDIEIRSGRLEAEAGNLDKVCCLLSVKTPPTGSKIDDEIAEALQFIDKVPLKRAEAESLRAKIGDFAELKEYTPNSEVYRDILRILGMKTK